MSRCPWEHTFPDGQHLRCKLPEDHAGSHLGIVNEILPLPNYLNPLERILIVPVIREWTE